MACDGEILLVSSIEKRPFIYDFNHKDHSNKIVQDMLWEEISTETNVILLSFSSKCCNLYHMQIARSSSDDILTTDFCFA